MHLQPVIQLTITLLFASRAQLLFGAKESGSSETNSEQDDVKEDTDTKKRKRRKQKKIGEDLWTFTEREEVESLPVGIDGLNVYIVNRKDEKELKECLKDGRKWRKDCPTKWKGHERVRYADCRGSYKCNNSACPFLTEYVVRNTKQWRKRAGKVLCQGCWDSGSYVPCHARRYLCYEKKGVTVFHYGFHTCPVSSYVMTNKEESEHYQRKPKYKAIRDTICPCPLSISKRRRLAVCSKKSGVHDGQTMASKYKEKSKKRHGTCGSRL